MEIEQMIAAEQQISSELNPLLSNPLPTTINKKPIRIFLLLTALLVVAKISTASAEIDVIYLLICYHEGIESGECFASPKSGELAGSLTVYANTVVALGGVFVTPLLTSNSDRTGRRPLFIYSVVMAMIAQAIEWWLVFGTEGTPHYMWLMIPLVVSTVGGGTSMATPLAVSYISDIIDDPDERARYISFVEGTLFVAIALGPTLGSTLYTLYGLDALYKISIFSMGATALLAYFILNESLTKDQQQTNTATAKLGIIESCKMLTYKHIQEPKRRQTARLFTICSVFGTEVTLAVLNVIFLYVKTRFHWSGVQTGYFVTITSTERFVALMAGFPMLFKLFSSWWPTQQSDIDRTDLTMLRIALGFCSVGFGLMTVATRPATFVAAAMVESASSLANPIYRSALIKYAPEGQFGSFMGSISLVTSIMALIIPTLLLKVYSFTVSSWPGLAFLVSATCFTGLFVFTFSIRPKV